MELINSLHPALWIKIITLISIGFYIVFTFVIFNQVRAMSQILHLPHAERVLRAISIIHVLLAISLFLFAVVIL